MTEKYLVVLIDLGSDCWRIEFPDVPDLDKLFFGDLSAAVKFAQQDCQAYFFTLREKYHEKPFVSEARYNPADVILAEEEQRNPSQQIVYYYAEITVRSGTN